jgi:hypothetical protein
VRRKRRRGRRGRGNRRSGVLSMMPPPLIKSWRMPTTRYMCVVCMCEHFLATYHISLDYDT